MFFEGEQLAKRDKVAPWNETWIEGDLFKPGKGIELFHINNKSILVEICREHAMPKPATLAKADIHYVLSDSIDFIPSYQHGKLALHLDSVLPSQYYYQGDSDELQQEKTLILLDDTLSKLPKYQSAIKNENKALNANYTQTDSNNRF